MVEALQKVRASGSKVKLLRSLSMPTQLSLGSLSLVLNLTIKKSVDLPYTNWLGAGTALPMSSRQSETSLHRGIKCDVAGWNSRKCLCETVAWAARHCVNEYAHVNLVFYNKTLLHCVTLAIKKKRKIFFGFEIKLGKQQRLDFEINGSMRF